MLKQLICVVLVAATSVSTAAVAVKDAALETIEIYFIDVEGGQSTLVITPDHHSLLIDTGWAGEGSGFKPMEPQRARDANRIVAAARDAGVTRIDYLLITHFHPDHDGGVLELSKLIPIGVFIDHGSPSSEAQQTSPETKEAFDAYLKVRGQSAHLEPQPGDHLPLAGLDATVVSSGGKVLATSLPAGSQANAACTGHATPARDPYENPRSTGILLVYGKFRFLDVGDLTGQPLYNLVCPTNLIGPTSAYLVAHHGGPDVMIPETFAAFRPRVAIMNNGQTKGGSRLTYQALHRVSDLEDVWQLHASAEAGDSNFPPPNIANLDESTAHWIKLVAKYDGSFSVFNQRTGRWKSYASRPM